LAAAGLAELVETPLLTGLLEVIQYFHQIHLLVVVLAAQKVEHRQVEMVVQEEGVGLVESLPRMLAVLVIHHLPHHLRVITEEVVILREILVVAAVVVQVLLEVLGVELTVQTMAVLERHHQLLELRFPVLVGVAVELVVALPELLLAVVVLEVLEHPETEQQELLIPVAVAVVLLEIMQTPVLAATAAPVS
jgi:hypothetical protein